MCNLKRQKGAVLVIALFFVALIVTMATLMMSRLERDTRRTGLLLHAVQAEFYALASVDWAKEQLRSNLNRQKPEMPVDNFPIESPVNEVNGYSISSKIIDMQSRININNLVKPEAQADLKQLIQLLQPGIDEHQVNEIVLAVSDWLKPGQQHNEYNQYYLSLKPPYRAAHRPMVSVSELQLVKGMTPALYNSLLPYITALPNETKVNIQTAEGAVIAAISQGMTLETGRAIEKIRSETKIPSVEAFAALDIVKNHKVPGEKIIVISNYFLIETTVAIEKQKLVLYTLVERSGDKGKNSIRVVWQSKGVEN
jgi:general secretion pathway protein K